MKKKNTPLILIIDDEKAILKTLSNALTDESHRVETLADGQKALEVIGNLVPDLVLLDIFMPNCNGIDLLAKIKKEYPDQKVIIISGFGNIPIAIEAIQKGAIDFIEKPLNLDEILNKIHFLQEDPEQIKQQKFTTDKELLQSCGIVGESNLFLELIQQTEKVAPHNFPVLIYGEHGTGKTALARYIHQKSNLCKEVFTTIRCDISEEISRPKPTLTKQTLYFKNIEKLDTNAQQKLLHYLEHNHAAVRIIASSRSNLFHMMRKKLFNETLFYHLNKAPLEVPPLRKRPYDIPILINHYLDKYNAQYKKKVVLTTQGIRLLRNHQWPGNVIELRHAMEKIVVCSSNQYNVISISNLASLLGERQIQFIEEQSLLHFASLEEATEEFKKNFLLYLLKKNHYNIMQVSHRLNLSPVQLKNKLLELKINICNEGRHHG